MPRNVPLDLVLHVQTSIVHGRGDNEDIVRTALASDGMQLLKLVLRSCVSSVLIDLAS